MADPVGYTDIDYFLTKIKETELNKLLKDDDGEVQEDYLTDAIRSADSLINGYLKSVIETIPIEPVPDIIKQCSYYIASYYLHDRIQYIDIPVRVKDNYDLAVNFLKDVANGKANLDGVTEGTDSDIWYDAEGNIFNKSMF